MTKNMISPRVVLTLAAAATALVACGGGGSTTEPVTASAPVNDTTGNPFVAAVGTYTNPCQGFSAYPGSPASSKTITLVVSAPMGASNATASYRSMEYIGSSTCEAASLTTDITVTGKLTALSATKEISIQKAQFGEVEFIGTTRSFITGTASTATFSLDKLSFATGAFSVPALGASTTVGYMFKNGKFYGLVNARNEADGLGAYFSATSLTKQ